MWNQLRLVFVWVLVIAPSCADDPGERDPRLGELGRVKFNGGGGCNGSTTLAAGSTAKMRLEAVDGTLPQDLQITSTRPEVIAARPGDDGDGEDTITLRAVGDGETRVELYTGESLLDWLGFDVVDAASATHEAPDAVLEGGRYVLEVKEIYGEFGEDEPLIGADFMRWDTDPAGAFVLVEDEGRRAQFAASSAGPVTISASDPATGVELLEHEVTVVAVGDAGELSASITVDPPGDEDEVSEPAPPPLTMPEGSLFVVKLTADSPAGEVAIFGEDIEWQVLEGQVLQGGENYSTPEGPIFTSEGAGPVTLRARVALLDAEIEIALDVDEVE